MPEPKTSEEHGKELTMSEEILEHVVEQIDGTVVESPEIPSPHVSFGVVKPETNKRSSAEELKELVYTFPDFLQDDVIPSLKYLDGKRGKYAMLKNARFYVDMIRSMIQIKRAAAVKMAEEMTKECAKATASLKVREEQL